MRALGQVFTGDQLEKIGNTVIYLSGKIPNMSKTKLLKLLYILDELSIERRGIPFLNLQYKLWKLGPVNEEIFIDLSDDRHFLGNYIKVRATEDAVFITPAKEFCDDEFSDHDMMLMDMVIRKFGKKTGRELIEYTHREGAPWYRTAIDNHVLNMLLEERMNNTEIVIDMGMLISHDEHKYGLYKEYKELFS